MLITGFDVKAIWNLSGFNLSSIITIQIVDKSLIYQIIRYFLWTDRFNNCWYTEKTDSPNKTSHNTFSFANISIWWKFQISTIIPIWIPIKNKIDLTEPLFHKFSYFSIIFSHVTTQSRTVSKNDIPNAPTTFIYFLSEPLLMFNIQANLYDFTQNRVHLQKKKKLHKSL